MDRPIVVTGCTLRKFSWAKPVQGVRLEDYCRDDCAGCGFHELERARRAAAIRDGALRSGPDGLRRLYLSDI